MVVDGADYDGCLADCRAIGTPREEAGLVLGSTGNVREVMRQPYAAALIPFTPTVRSSVWWHGIMLRVSTGMRPVTDCKSAVTQTSTSQAPRALANPAPRI